MVALNERVLIVTDGALRLPPVTPGVSIDVLGLGRDAITWRTELEAARHGRTDVTLLDVEPWSDDVSQAVGAFLIPLIHDMPETPGPDGRALGTVLTRADGGNDWWYLEVSEKSPLRGGLVRSLYHLGLMREAVRSVRYARVCWAVNDPRLRAAFQSAGDTPAVEEGGGGGTPTADPSAWRYWAQAARATVEVLGVRLIAHLAKWPSHTRAGAARIFTLYPHWWLRPYTAGASDRFFPDLDADRADLPLDYLTWWSGGLGAAWRRRHEARAVMTQKRMLLLQRHVPLRVLLQLYSPRTFARLQRFRRLVARSTWTPFFNCDVRPLLDREIARSIGSGELALDRMVQASVRSALTASPAGALLFRFEAQPLDRALTLAARGMTTAIGYWHSAIALCPNYLPFWFVPGALAPTAPAGRIAPMPMPDAMLATETICEDTLTAQGFPAARVARCGPVRHVEAMSVARRGLPRAHWRRAHDLPDEGTVVFVATSVVATDALAMVRAVARAVQDLHAPFVLVRVHPAMGLPGQVWQELEEAVGSSRLRRITSSEHLYELMAAADVVITGGSTLAFEAMALGVMPVLFESPGDFSASSFAPFGHACFVVRNAAALAAALRDVVEQSPEWGRRVAAWPQLGRDVFGDIHHDRNERFHSALGALVRESAC